MALPLQHPVVRPNASGRRRPEDRDVSWRERLQALKHLPRLLRLVWETEPRYVVGILVLRVLRSLVPLAVLWVGKLIVDEVVTAIGSVHAGGALPWTRLGQLLLLELVIALVGEGLSRVSALLEKNRTQGLTSDEQSEWERYQYLEHLVRLAKTRAAMKLKAA